MSNNTLLSDLNFVISVNGDVHPQANLSMARRVHAEIARLAVLTDLLRLHRCNSDGRQSVGECVDQGQCGCSCGLLLRPATEKGEPT